MDPTSDPPAGPVIANNVIVSTGDNAGHITPAPEPTWLVTMAERSNGFWIGPGDPPPLVHLKPGEHKDYTLAPQIPIRFHSVCVGDGWHPEVSVTGPGCETVVSLKPAERLGGTAQRWELASPIEVGPNSVMTMIKLRLINRSVETRTERDAILMRMPHLAQREPGIDLDHQRVKIRTAMHEGVTRLLEAANRARLASLHDLADALVSQTQIVELLLAHKDIRSP